MGSPDSSQAMDPSSEAAEPPSGALSRHGTTTFSPEQAVALTSSGAPLLNPRSCVTCRRRKVRCDKQMPCSNCRRASAQCVFPAPGRAPRRPKPRDPNAPSKGSSEREVELMRRLRKLEGIVEDLSGQIEVETASSEPRPLSAGTSPGTAPLAQQDMNAAAARAGSGSAGSPSSANGTSAVPSMREVVARRGAEADIEAAQGLERKQSASVTKQLGRLVLHDQGRTNRYVSSAFWSKLNDELDELRAEMHSLSHDDDDSEDDETPDHSPQQPVEPSTDHHGFIFGYRSADVDLRRLHPLPSQIPFLWQVYKENVEPLVKILHVPSMEELLRTMRKSPDSLSPANEALIFAIYFSAIISMEDEEVQTNFGSSRPHLLSQYRFALEQALARANFLNTSDMVVLQAFTLFLTIVRRHDDTRFCWTLTGLAIRMAQGMGIHRDGLQLGLPPFEVEMRRRLWWAICTIDLRSAEELGTDMIIRDGSFDTELPTSINDTDIDPSATVMPTPREGRTDTAVSLVRYEICSLARQLHVTVTEMGPIDPTDVTASLEHRERMLVDVYDRIEEKFLRRCLADNDPLFWMAAMIARVIAAKIGLIIYQPFLFPGTGPELSFAIRTRLFVSTIEVVEYNHILNTDPRCRQWRWLFQTYRQWHAIAYMLLEMARRPWTPTSERAWEAASILGYESHPIEAAKAADHTAVSLPVKKLYLNARRHRQAEIQRLRSDPEAAHHLDVEDRLNSLPERLGSVPGMEARASQLRGRWRKLVRGENSTGPLPPFEPLPTQDEQRLDFVFPAAGAVPQPNVSALRQDEFQPGSEGEFVDKLLSGVVNPIELWRYAYQGRLSAEDMLAIGMTNGDALPSAPANGTMQHGAAIDTALSAANKTMSEQTAALQGQPPQQQQQPQQPQQGGRSFEHGANQAPPTWLWPDPFTSMDPLLEGAGMDGLNDMVGADDLDMNMDVEDINWQNWQESLKGLEKPTSSHLPGSGHWGGL
ncbi:Transcription factor vrtR1 like protein [Verticillium longisporum]|uniref:Transcription factor vrtR1 like protein n=1 Tax=Verticillium longisporum TaxID=100787 RepID=A0A8I2ZX45_VERLO|nr:Transcription factor vrtR1 like protein [Verticillium longisporum]